MSAKVRIIVSGNRQEVMGLLNKLMECHGRDAKVAEVFPEEDDRFSNWIDRHEESLRVDKIVPKQAC